jgi:hypothetical protein
MVKRFIIGRGWEAQRGSADGEALHHRQVLEFLESSDS